MSRSVFAAAVVTVGLALGAGAYGAPVPWTEASGLADLTGPWKFHPGDDPARAAPDFVDVGWATIDIPTGFGRRDVEAELAWYRLEIQVGPPHSRLSDEERRDLRLGVTIGKVDSAYELYAGGRLLGGVGALPPAPRMDYDRHGTYAVPSDAVDAEGRLVLALRVWKSPETRSDVGGPHEGPFLFGRLEDLTRRELLADLPSLFLAAIFLLLGLIHLELFRRRPQQAGYLWLGLTVIAAAGHTFLRTQWKYALTDRFAVLKEVEHLLVYLILATLIQFLWPLLGLRISPWLRVCQGLAVACGVLVAATPGLALNIRALPFFQAGALAVVVAGTWAIFSQAWRQHPEARIVAVGAIANGAFFFNDVVVDRGLIAGPRLMHFGFAALVLSLAVSLGNRFQRVHQDLEELDRLYSLSLDMLCVVGTDGYFRRVNPAFTRTLGFSAEDMLARPLVDFVHPEDRAATLKRLEGLARGEPVVDGENRYRCRDGSYRWLSWRSFPVPERGIVYSIARDVTEKRRAAEALARANAARGEFLRNMSHEIRTPMNAIIALSNLLVKGELPAEERAWAASVKTSAEGLLRVIDDILDFSKIEAGKLEIETVDFALRQTLAGVVALLAPRAEKQGVELRLEIGDAVPDALSGDPTRLRQVLLNLVGNAIKFTEEGSVVLAVTSGPPGDGTVEMRFAVRDTGIGIEPGAQARLFEAFTQADSSTTRRFGGTGLGLAISRRIVGLMGGEIELESAPGKGSTFRFAVPFALAGATGEEAGDAAAPAAARDRDRRSSRRLLVVEDDELNRSVVLRVLRGLGYRAEAVVDGVEALAALERERYSLVLMDCQMPELDGYETTRRLRRRERGTGRHLPVIAMTAHAMRGERERCFAAGMDDYVSKPFTEERLAAVLDRWLADEPTPAAAGPGGSNDARSNDASRLRSRTIESFLRQSPSKLETLHRALADNDAGLLAATAHTMTGNAGFIGAAELSDRCRRLEDLARRGSLAECAEPLRQVEAAYRRTAAELEETLAARGGRTASPASR